MTTLIWTLLAIGHAKTFDPADRCRKLPAEIERRHDLNCDWVLRKGNKFERYCRCECREVAPDQAKPRVWMVEY